MLSGELTLMVTVMDAVFFLILLSVRSLVVLAKSFLMVSSLSLYFFMKKFRTNGAFLKIKSTTLVAKNT